MKGAAQQSGTWITCALLVWVGLAGARVEAQPAKIVYLVRHAEKAAQDGDPGAVSGREDPSSGAVTFAGKGPHRWSIRNPVSTNAADPWSLCPWPIASRSRPLGQTKSKS